MLQALVLHHAVPEHRAAFLAFMHRVIDTTRDVAGLVEFSAWDTHDGPLIAISRWQSDQAFQQAMPQILALSHERQAEWTDRDDELFLAIET